MPDNAASTDRWSRGCLLIGAGLVGLILVGGTFIALRLRAVYRMEHTVRLMQIEHADLMRGYTLKFEESQQRLDTLERVLFGDIVAKVYSAHGGKPTAKPVFGKVEQWMLNQNKLLDERLDQLEAWRLSQGKEE